MNETILPAIVNLRSWHATLLTIWAASNIHNRAHVRATSMLQRMFGVVTQCRWRSRLAVTILLWWASWVTRACRPLPLKWRWTTLRATPKPSTCLSSCHLMSTAASAQSRCCKCCKDCAASAIGFPYSARKMSMDIRRLVTQRPRNPAQLFCLSMQSQSLICRGDVTGTAFSRRSMYDWRWLSAEPARSTISTLKTWGSSFPRSYQLFAFPPDKISCSPTHYVAEMLPYCIDCAFIKQPLQSLSCDDCAAPSPLELILNNFYTCGAVPVKTEEKKKVCVCACVCVCMCVCVRESMCVCCTLGKLAEICVALRKLAEIWRSGTSGVQRLWALLFSYCGRDRCCHRAPMQLDDDFFYVCACVCVPLRECVCLCVA